MDVTIIVLKGATAVDLIQIVTELAPLLKQDVTPELEQAINKLGQSIQAVDDLIPDSTSN